MNDFQNLVLTASMIVLCVGAAIGQTSARAATSVPLDVTQGFVVATEIDGAPFAAGRDYKARFRDTGVAFTPMLGGQAPRNLPLTLSLRHVRRGAAKVEAPPVRPTRDGRTVRYVRDGFVERYDVRSEGLEQSFEFGHRPAGEGDLVVQIAAATELVPEPRPDGTVAWVWPGLGGVHLGAVTGIDADGHTCPGTVRLAPGGLELVLPAAFVDTAVYPLVLDPLIGAEFYTSPTSRAFLPNVCATSGTGTYADRFLVTYVVQASFRDSDVHAVQIENGAVVPGTEVVLAAGDDEIETGPRMGFYTVGASLGWVGSILWASSPFAPFRLRLVAVAPYPNSTPRSSGLFETLTGLDADFVGKGGATVGDGVVVWGDAAGIGGRLAGGLLIGVQSPVRLVADPEAVDVAIGKHRGPAGEILLVWCQPVLGTAAVFAQRFTGALQPIGSPLRVSDTTHGASAPRVDGDLDGSGSWLVAWERNELAGAPGLRDIAAARIVRTTTGLAIATPQTLVEATVGEDEFTPDVADLGSRFLLAWAQNSTTDDGCRAKLLRDDCTRCNDVMEFDGLAASARTRTPSIAAQVPGAADSRPTMLVFAEQAALASARVVAQGVAAEAAGTPPLDLGGGCGLGGTAGTSGGGFVVGNDEFALTVTGADPSAILFRSLGFPGSGIQCALCTLTQPLAFEFAVNVAGSASTPYPVPCTSAFTGLALEFQWVSFLSTWNPCPAAPGLSATNRLQIQLTN